MLAFHSVEAPVVKTTPRLVCVPCGMDLALHRALVDVSGHDDTGTLRRPIWRRRLKVTVPGERRARVGSHLSGQPYIGRAEEWACEDKDARRAAMHAPPQDLLKAR